MFGDLSVSTTNGSAEDSILVKPISQLLCFLPDVVINLLQNTFVTPQDIQVQDDVYSIKYSPGIIFSGTVPAFDVDFLDPMESITASDTQKGYASVVDALVLNGAKKIDEQASLLGGADFNSINQSIKNNYNYDVSRQIDLSKLDGTTQSYEDETNNAILNTEWKSKSYTIDCAWYSDDRTSIYVIVDYLETIATSNMGATSSEGIVYLYEIDSLENLNKSTSAIGMITDISTETKTYDSTTSILKPIISSWYNALRKIALVGLLSVLVYIGIRIVIASTSAQDKAKYKKMLKDWLIALCILFVLHYIISICTIMVENINEVLKVSTIAENGEDIMMTTLRNEIARGVNWSSVIVQVVLYFVLAIYIIIFTIQYLKRTIYLAFLTVIAPLITLTYPLDKIKDNKSQAFDMWVKDYIFFTLIQVVHLLVYYILVGSSLDLANKGNWIFAIVAIGFLVPAEKIIKKMFGFEKSNTLGAMAAGATGALVMNAMSKLRKRWRKQKKWRISRCRR